MVILHKIDWANGTLEKGKEMEGRMYLLKAIKDWSEVRETPLSYLVPMIACIVGISLSEWSKTNQHRWPVLNVRCKD